MTALLPVPLSRAPIVLAALLAACAATPMTSPDAGPTEPPSPDAAPVIVPLRPAIPCSDTLPAVYAVDPGPAAPTPSERGAILHCATHTSIDAASVDDRLREAGVAGIVTSTAVDTFVIAYRTTRRPDVGGVGSARVYLPATPRSGPLPVVVFAHGTAGLADQCALSKIETIDDANTLPWAARGYVVIAPDYAGLGTAGVQGYGNGTDSAYSVLDAARALRAMFPEGTFADPVVISGHSQGGGVALYAQGWAREYGAGGTVAAVVSYAGGYTYEITPGIMQFPNLPTRTIPVQAAIGALSLYAFFANRYGADRAGEGFPWSTRDALEDAIEQHCIYQLASSIADIAPTVDDLVRPAFRIGHLSCIDGGVCEGQAREYYEERVANLKDIDPAGAPVLSLQGLQDDVAGPGRTACIVDHLRARGVRVTSCTHRTADHMTIVPLGVARAIEWSEAILAGQTPESCVDELPACGA